MKGFIMGTLEQRNGETNMEFTVSRAIYTEALRKASAFRFDQEGSPEMVNWMRAHRGIGISALIGTEIKITTRSGKRLVGTMTDNMMSLEFQNCREIAE